MPRLSVNLNKIALIRNARGGNRPGLQRFVEIAVAAGAGGITVHPRPDQRHIRANDILPLRRVSERLGVEFNIEGNPFAAPRAAVGGDYPGLLELVRNSRPDQCTLVPDADEQLTSDRGFGPADGAERLRELIDQLSALQVRTSLFMEPRAEQMGWAAAVGARRVELFTGPYAAAAFRGEGRDSLDRYRKAAAAAIAAGLGINAGHDLDLNNLAAFVKAMPQLLEVSIGHALTADALEMGFERAVRSYLALLGDG